MADINNGKSSTFGRNLMQYVASKLPFSGTNSLDVTDELNPKYRYFQDTGERRSEALANQSISQNFEFNTTPIGSITSDTTYGNVLYANVQKDKLARVKDYRIMAAFSEVSNALDEICDEVINIDTHKGSAVNLKIVNTTLNEYQTTQVDKEFSKYINYFDLEHKGWEYFRQLLVEGELYWEHIIHKDHVKEGILGIAKIASETIDPVFSNVQNDLLKGFLYRKPVFDKNNPLKMVDVKYVPMDRNQVTYVHSHVWNESKTMRVPFLENCRRAYRQLTMVEDAIIIYRLARAPERLVFNVDVGNAAGPKAEAILNKLVSQYWSSKTYDPGSGGLVQKFNPQSILDNFWFAKRAGSEGTTVQQLPGGCFSMDTKVPLLDGRILTISEIEEELKAKKDVWVYSCDPETGNIKPGIVSWAGVTRRDSDVMRLTLDNGKEITCTLDHKFPIINRGFVEAKDLVVGDSLIPFNSKRQKMGKKGNDYEMVYQNDTKEWVYTHRMVSRFNKTHGIQGELVYDERLKGEKKDVIHHKDLNRFNNNPDNLVLMNGKDHILLHRSIKFPEGVGTAAALARFKELKKDEAWYENFKNKSKETFKRFNNSLTEKQRSELLNKRKQGLKEYFANLSDDTKRELRERCIKNSLKGANKLQNKFATDSNYKKEFYQKVSIGQKNKFESMRISGEYSEFIKNRTEKLLQSQSYLENIRQLTENQTLVFDKKILDKVAFLVKGKTRFEITREDICNEINNNPELLQLFLESNKDKNIKNWDRTGLKPTHFTPMVKSFGYKNWRQFRNESSFYNHKVAKIEFLSEKIDVGTLTIDKDEVYHDHHTFALDAGVFTKNSNLGELQDLMYFIKKLYQSLKVPTTRLDPQDAFRDGADMLREELKFAKFIIRLQQSFAEGLKNGFITHLQLKGMWKDYKLKEQNISLNFNVPTNFYELRESQKLELKTTTFSNIASQESVSPTYAQKRYLGWTDIEIKANREFLRKDKAFRWELTQIEQYGPNWREVMQQQADAGGAGAEGFAGGEGVGGASGGGGMPPPFTGGPASTGAEAPEGGAPETSPTPEGGQATPPPTPEPAQ